MIKRFNYIFVVLAAFIFSPHSYSQNEGNASIKLDTPRIRLGEQTRLEITFRYDKNKHSKKIEWPEIDDTIRKEIEVIEKGKLQTASREGGITEIKQQLTITSFDSGFWVIHPFKFYLEGDTVPIAESNALVFEVNTLPTDTAEASVRDIKPIFEEKTDWRAYLPAIYWTIGILAIIGLTILIIYLARKKKKEVPAKVKVPAEQPHITALRNLELIRQQKIWTEGKYKEYYTGITDTLRLYIEGRFKVHAMELTTDEILQVMRSQVIDPESKGKLKQILELADYVKFAKAIPIDVENEMTINNAFDFVNGTKREENFQLHSEEGKENLNQ